MERKQASKQVSKYEKRKGKKKKKTNGKEKSKKPIIARALSFLKPHYLIRSTSGKYFSSSAFLIANC
jgi:hypothetical protein